MHVVWEHHFFLRSADVQSDRGEGRGRIGR
jgi:hypothetical protein